MLFSRNNVWSEKIIAGQEEKKQNKSRRRKHG